MNIKKLIKKLKKFENDTYLGEPLEVKFFIGQEEFNLEQPNGIVSNTIYGNDNDFVVINLVKK